MKLGLSVLVAQPLSLVALCVLGLAGCTDEAQPDIDPIDGVAGAAGAMGSAGAAGAMGLAGASGAAGAPPATLVPYDPDGPLGWASVPGLELDGTIGGQGGEETTVTTSYALINHAGRLGPAIVRVAGELVGSFQIQSDKTLIGEPGAVIVGNLSLIGVHNVIIKNLTIRGNNCTDGDQCSHGRDAITVKGSHHVWFDHLDVSDGSDGNLDVTEGADYVTISNSKFWYSDTSRNHRFSNLVGAADNNPIDEGKLRVTFYRNWWADNVEQRMPRTRYGEIHVLNNLYTSDTSDYCINAGFAATVLVEGNVFRGVKDPHEVSSGQLLARDNVYEDIEGEPQATDVGFLPPYAYPAVETEGLADSIMDSVGPE